MNNCCEVKHEKIREMLKTSEDYLENVKTVSNIFSLLGEVNRMKILLALLEGELCVYHICEITGGKQSATSQHLRKLKDCHIVKSRKDANQVLYSLADDHVVNIIKLALEHKEC
ncbi:MAG: helix-turn-helix transcriptional regulator [Clostridiales bacterium]|nr:helix-turn-helix transcriptional regulator [Clostridiales bacterium]